MTACTRPRGAVRERAAGPHARARASATRVRNAAIEQAVLVAEVVGHQARGDAGAARDLRKSRADVADFRETIDGDVDQLGPTGLLAAVTLGRAVADRGLPGSG